jgi:hypothetical protein
MWLQRIAVGAAELLAVIILFALAAVIAPILAILSTTKKQRRNSGHDVDQTSA